jgi:hypothetical protein
MRIEVSPDGEAPSPRERPVGECRIRVSRFELDGPPKRQNLIGQVEADRLQARDRTEPRVPKDE